MSASAPFVQRIADVDCWVSPTPDRRRFRVLVDPTLTGSVNLAAGTLILPPGQEQPSAARHPVTEEVYYVIRGHGQAELSGESYPIGEGDVIYVPPNTDHRLINTDPANELEILFVNTPALSDYKPVLEGWQLVPAGEGGE